MSQTMRPHPISVRERVWSASSSAGRLGQDWLGSGRVSLRCGFRTMGMGCILPTTGIEEASILLSGCQEWEDYAISRLSKPSTAVFSTPLLAYDQQGMSLDSPVPHNQNPIILGVPYWACVCPRGHSCLARRNRASALLPGLVQINRSPSRRNSCTNSVPSILGFVCEMMRRVSVFPDTV
jgi:hypothetical protein